MDTDHPPVVAPPEGDADGLVGGTVECRPQNDVSDCCLACFPLLELFGCVYTAMWLTPDPETRCAKLLTATLTPNSAAEARAYITRCSVPASVAPPGTPARPALPDCLAQHADLLGLCAHTVQTHHTANRPRYVDPDRFLPQQLDGTRDMWSACTQCCCAALVRDDSVMAYTVAACPAAERSALKRPDNDDAADLLQAHIHGGGVVVRLCRVLGMNACGTQLLIADQHFASLQQYRERRAGLSAEMMARLERCRRRPDCLECLLSPAVAILDRCGEDTAFPSVHIAVYEAKASGDVLRTWGDARCIHSANTLQAGSDKVTTALTWCFGGVENARGTFMEVVKALACNHTVLDAVRLVHDILLDNYQMLKERDALSIGVRNNFIRPHLLLHQLYSYRTGLIVR